MYEFINPVSGKPMKSILPNDILMKIADLIEIELKQREVYYERKPGTTVFRLTDHGMAFFHAAQRNANRKLVDDGVITMEMLIKDAEANGVL